MDRHDGFAKSVFAWVPSRGTSGIAVPGGVSMHLPDVPRRWGCRTHSFNVLTPPP